MPNSVSPCPFDIGTLQTARCLIRLHQRLRGELIKASTVPRQLLVDPDLAKQYMHHIEGLMPLLGVNFEPEKLKPIRTLPHDGPLNHGQLRAEVFKCLRAEGRPLTAKEVARLLRERHSIRLDADSQARFLQKIREALHALKRKGAAQSLFDYGDGPTTREQQWTCIGDYAQF